MEIGLLDKIILWWFSIFIGGICLGVPLLFIIHSNNFMIKLVALVITLVAIGFYIYFIYSFYGACIKEEAK